MEEKETNTIPIPGPPKITFSQWLKHPTTAVLILVSVFAYSLGFIWVNSQLEEVSYLKKRISILESREAEHLEEMKKYTRTLIFKETQLKEQSKVINELKTDTVSP